MSETLHSPPRNSLTERLDRLPFTRRHASLLAGSGVGWALDAFDVGLISFVIAQLSVTWKSDAAALSWVASAGFAGMAIGAAVGGLLADKLGRKQVFALTLLLYGAATGASALAGSVGVLLLLRFIVGLGLGAELPVASTLVSEFAPRRIRGRIVVLEAFWAVGWVGSALVGYLVIPGSPDGWRWALLIGVLPAVWAVFVRLRMPESVRFLESKGRHSEAEKVVRQFEASAGTASAAQDHRPVAAVGRAPVPASGLAAWQAPVRTRLMDLFAPDLRQRSALIWAVWFLVNFSYYGAFIWLPTLLVSAGFPLVKSFEYTLIITLAQLPGYAASASLVEKWGRRITLSTFLVGSAIAAAAFGFGAVNGSESQIIASGMLLSFFNLGAWGALYAVTPELYPTRLRGSGSGSAAGFGRLASIAAPLLVPPLLVLGGTLLLFIVFAIVFVFAACAAFALPELRGKPLTE
ncbi:MFS transporter [Paenarthrobacter sp. Z7-10]|uniref:MFS transporter n=1 Tax=Paenarthrobacter sp. Z7-10 TaxID=2787635 RepID=UPI0022A9803B|nr:MFS transporter [Paenarthrobacter sp. Z7-10]MCZ2403169.1 MFS transporter [Paenarthrobacter sp. Z7-10]